MKIDVFDRTSLVSVITTIPGFDDGSCLIIGERNLAALAVLFPAATIRSSVVGAIESIGSPALAAFVTNNPAVIACAGSVHPAILKVHSEVSVLVGSIAFNFRAFSTRKAQSALSNLAPQARCLAVALRSALELESVRGGLDTAVKKTVCDTVYAINEAADVADALCYALNLAAGGETICAFSELQALADVIQAIAARNNSEYAALTTNLAQALEAASAAQFTSLAYEITIKSLEALKDRVRLDTDTGYR